MRVDKERFKEELKTYRKQNAERKNHVQQTSVRHYETGDSRRRRSGSWGLGFGR